MSTRTVSTRTALGVALGVTSAALGSLLVSPTLNDRTWMPQAFLSEFPWTATLLGGAAAVASSARSPRQPWGAALGLLGVGLSLVPLVQVRQAISDMDDAMRAGLGSKYQEAIHPALRARVQARHWSLNTTLRVRSPLSGVVITRNVVYAQPGLRALKFDIYQPQNPPPVGDTYPAVITIHGGAWRSYDKGGVFVPHHAHLARQGYVVFDMQYRFSNEAKFPAQIQDVQCAVRWVRRRAAAYRIDPARLALLGRSSGGHMALLAAYRANDAQLAVGNEDEAVDSRVSAVVAVYAPTDLRLWRSVPGGALVELMGGTTDQMPQAYTDASPVTFVRDDLPPTLLVQGYMDELVMPQHAELLHNLLRGTNTPTALLRIPWSRHVFDALMSGLGAQLAQYYVDRFLAWTLYRETLFQRYATREFPGVPWS